ncbi:MAG: pilus assembly protein [Micromonosporaceae bacterium]|nr:pilus assembly protein [Micromonosporaceae bacterium]
MVRDEDGSLSLELVLVTPALILLLLFVVFAGRLGSASADVAQATAQAARAASLQGQPGAAAAAADAAVADNLNASGVDCAALDVAVDTSAFAPGGTVTVRVRCSVALADIAGALPGTRALTAESVQVIDTYRGEGG